MSSSDQTLIKAFEKICTMADRMKLGWTIVDRATLVVHLLDQAVRGSITGWFDRQCT